MKCSKSWWMAESKGGILRRNLTQQWVSLAVNDDDIIIKRILREGQFFR